MTCGDCRHKGEVSNHWCRCAVQLHFISKISNHDHRHGYRAWMNINHDRKDCPAFAPKEVKDGQGKLEDN